MNSIIPKLVSAIVQGGKKSPALLVVVVLVAVAAYFDFLPSQVVVEVCSSAFGSVAK